MPQLTLVPRVSLLPFLWERGRPQLCFNHTDVLDFCMSIVISDKWLSILFKLHSIRKLGGLVIVSAIIVDGSYWQTIRKCDHFNSAKQDVTDTVLPFGCAGRILTLSEKQSISSD